MDKVPKKKTMSFNFSWTFPLLDFLTLEDGTNRLPQNVCNELSLYAMQYLRRAEGSHDNLVMQALVWLQMVQFRAIQFVASYMNLRPHIFKHQIYGKNLILHSSKYVILINVTKVCHWQSPRCNKNMFRRLDVSPSSRGKDSWGYHFVYPQKKARHWTKYWQQVDMPITTQVNCKR